MVEKTFLSSWKERINSCLVKFLKYFQLPYILDVNYSIYISRALQFIPSSCNYSLKSNLCCLTGPLLWNIHHNDMHVVFAHQNCKLNFRLTNIQGIYMPITQVIIQLSLHYPIHNMRIANYLEYPYLPKNLENIEITVIKLQ